MSHATKLDVLGTAIALTATVIAVTTSSHWSFSGSIEPSFEIAALESPKAEESETQPITLPVSLPISLPASPPSAWSSLQLLGSLKSTPSTRPSSIRQAAVYPWSKLALTDSAPKSSDEPLNVTSAELDGTLAYLDQLKTCTPSKAQHLSIERQILGWQDNQCAVEARFVAIAQNGDVVHQTRACQFSQADINQLTAAEVVNTLQVNEMTGLYELGQRLKAVTDSSCTTTDSAH